MSLLSNPVNQIPDKSSQLITLMQTSSKPNTAIKLDHFFPRCSIITTNFKEMTYFVE